MRTNGIIKYVDHRTHSMTGTLIIGTVECTTCGTRDTGDGGVTIA